MIYRQLCASTLEYTPDVPPYGTQYLANQVPPSFQLGKGHSMHENAYIMNLQSCGGYIDGWSIKSQYDGERLDANHSACGHLINHHARRQNTVVYSFSWNEVLEHNNQMIGNNMIRGVDEDHFPLPNEMRSDGSPWYYDEIEGEIKCFPTRDEPPPPTNQLCGAALILTSPVSKGDELLLDYCLQEPLPKWAKDWYTTSQ
mmetsp:Transcript_31064/g.62662  ORF Transcript_31064/g.62662 Transcript_31064/m.62662 type:complete len:200 (-) Transcript_31064:59-658(-)